MWVQEFRAQGRACRGLRFGARHQSFGEGFCLGDPLCVQNPHDRSGQLNLTLKSLL